MTPKPNPSGSIRLSEKQKAMLAELANVLGKTKTDTVKLALSDLCKKKGLKFPGEDE